MNRDHDDFDDDEILQDGQSMRVPIQMLDSVQRSIALRDTGAAHRPGWRMSDADDADDDAADAHAEYCEWLRDAHRTPTVDADDEPYRPTSIADAKAEADAAYEERSAWMRDAWRGAQP